MAGGTSGGRRWGSPRETGYDRLAAELKNGVVHPAYLLWGNETFLTTRAVGQIIEIALGGTRSDPFNLSRFLAGESSLGEALAVAEEVPMLRGRRVVVFEEVTIADAYGFPKLQIKKGERQRLEEYLREPNPTTVLILTGSVADPKQRFLPELRPALQIYEMSTPPPERLLRWIPGKAAACGFKIEPDAASELLAEVGPSMLKLSTELEKLAAYCGEGEAARLDDVRALVAGSSDDNVFELSDAIGRRDVQGAMLMLRRIASLHVDGEIRILAEFRRRFSQWLAIRERLDRGQSPGEVAGGLGLPGFVVQRNAPVARRFAREELVRALGRSLEIERDLKRGLGDARTQMELLILELAGAGQAVEGVR